jgi:hypothetical protein
MLRNCRPCSLSESVEKDFSASEEEEEEPEEEREDFLEGEEGEGAEDEDFLEGVWGSSAPAAGATPAGPTLAATKMPAAHRTESLIPSSPFQENLLLLFSLLLFSFPKPYQPVADHS